MLRVSIIANVFMFNFDVAFWFIPKVCSVEVLSCYVIGFASSVTKDSLKINEKLHNIKQTINIMLNRIFHV